MNIKGIAIAMLVTIGTLAVVTRVEALRKVAGL